MKPIPSDLQAKIDAWKKRLKVKEEEERRQAEETAARVQKYLRNREEVRRG